MLKLPLALGTALAVFLPVALPVQAQSYDPMPAGECTTRVVINFICHDEMDNGSPLLYAIPSGYSGRYVLYANKIPGGSLSFGCISIRR